MRTSSKSFLTSEETFDGYIFADKLNEWRNGPEPIDFASALPELASAAGERPQIHRRLGSALILKCSGSKPVTAATATRAFPASDSSTCTARSVCDSALYQSSQSWPWTPPRDSKSS